ncbi:uncharacterized protein APUU_21337S [Aspergillus puulaauensis]|uniref:Uncharacterized protein n=1 Tax=Aspergillus puulaauensis TaxID=1220207 RepID=A0A7R8AKP0_9EURO|nr:uncharacterized protein APUU_21337S [Aspergillus puulaauensis]BCS20905.1 hypothetical protein APUU_21337S [Aspergillus puulaauensis]
MRVPLFFLFALCISKAAAFGLYGCYERLLYWQAYQMDEGSKKQKIAPACARDPKTAQAVGPVTGGRCNLRQFLYYITSDEAEKGFIADKNNLKDADLAKEKTDLDEVAKKMYHAHVGKTYKQGYIYQGLSSNSGINEVIDNVAGFIQQRGWDNGDRKPAQELFDQAEKARSRVEFGRKATMFRDIGAEIRKKYDREVWDKQPKNKNGEINKYAPKVDEGLVRERIIIPPGATEGWISCQPEAAQNSINAAGKGPVDLKEEFVQPWKHKDDAHQMNIQAAKNAKAKITECRA